jgi:hypothetical protein
MASNDSILVARQGVREAVRSGEELLRTGGRSGGVRPRIRGPPWLRAAHSAWHNIRAYPVQ